VNIRDGKLDVLYELVGKGAVLLPCGLCTKAPIDHRVFGEKRTDGSRDPGWQNTTFERTQEPDYQEQLNAAVQRGAKYRRFTGTGQWGAGGARYR
jgi:hypothetical protein